jgi:hypothetical protein
MMTARLPARPHLLATRVRSRRQNRQQRIPTRSSYMGGFAEFPVRVLEVINGSPLPAPTVQNVMAFGAVGNGVHDDAPAINAAIAAAGPGGTVYFPTGVYRVASSIVVNEPILLQGAGGLCNTSIGQVPASQIIGSGITIVSLQASGAGMQDLMVRDQIGNAATVGVQLGEPSNTSALVAITLTRCSIVSQTNGGTKNYLGTGVAMYFAISSVFSACTIEDWNHGVSFGSGSPVGSAESNASPLIACRVRENVIGIYVQANAAPDVMTTNCVIEGNAVGLWVEHSTSGNGTFVKDQGSHWENGNGSLTVPTASTIGTTPVNFAASLSGFYGSATFDVPLAGETPPNGTDCVFASAEVVAQIFGCQSPNAARWNGVGNLNFFGSLSNPGSFSGSGSAFEVAANQAIGLANPQVWNFNNVNEVDFSGAPIIKLGGATPLGGGATPTLGTIGGSGPTTAAQNGWVEFTDGGGASFWMPSWK